MAKASIKLPGGASVVIEGTPEEVNQILQLYSQESAGSTPSPPQRKKPKKRRPPAAKSSTGTGDNDLVDHSGIVNLIKTCDEAEAIETQILDRASQVDRTLLPLYIVHEYLKNEYGLTSGDVSKVTTDLGIPIAMPNASNTLSSTASRYVIGNKVRKRGQPVRYKLSRRGVQYLESVLEGADGEE